MNIGFVLIIALIFLILDYYCFQAFKTVFDNNKVVNILYILISLIPYCTLMYILFIDYFQWKGISKIVLVGASQVILFTKLMILPFLIFDDIIRIFKWIFSLFKTNTSTENLAINRLEFLSKIGLVLGSFAFGGFLYGIVRGAYNFTKTRIKLPIKNVPEALQKLKIIQISDFHIGSFANEKPIQNIINLINEENADIVFFTGDLVNYATKEALPYKNILKNIKSKYGIFSILGNHDYGNYYEWKTKEEEQQNLRDLIQFQKEIGWDLLLDEHRILDINGKKLAIIGIQYWGHSLRFGKFGKLDKAIENLEKCDVNLLLSHDPSHWDYEVSKNKNYEFIDATFSGHTHGFQMGIEIPKLKFQWSPSKYVYPHWAGLYSNNNQHLYVNRGIGFLGYPGRVGIAPEITIFEL